MPLYVIHALDKPGRLQARLDAYPAHRAYLGEQDGKGIRILGSGPLEKDDGSEMIGSHFIIEAEDIAAVKAFNAGDPFAKADVWDVVSIRRFALKRGPFAEALAKG
ncbi:MAG: YciI family protein [Beijerinckiaceae bacterium]